MYCSPVVLDGSVFSAEDVTQEGVMPMAPVFQTVPSVLAVCLALCIFTHTKQPQAVMSGLRVNLDKAYAHRNTHMRYC